MHRASQIGDDGRLLRVQGLDRSDGLQFGRQRTGSSMQGNLAVQPVAGPAPAPAASMFSVTIPRTAVATGHFCRNPNALVETNFQECAKFAVWSPFQKALSFFLTEKYWLVTGNLRVLRAFFSLLYWVRRRYPSPVSLNLRLGAVL
ncbi:MAG TPA: hypothetical protein VLY04_21295 [Bryobacteraceae bacterium]|nr:hypothetical protein [Bryobacteraceae bacterium]